MILMEHEWSVRDVCFLFCLDYPKVISFILLAPLSTPSSPQTVIIPLITVLTSRHISYRIRCKQKNRALHFFHNL